MKSLCCFGIIFEKSIPIYYLIVCYLCKKCQSVIFLLVKHTFSASTKAKDVWRIFHFFYGHLTLPQLAVVGVYMQWPHSGVSPSSAWLGWAQHNKTADKKVLNFNVISNSENIHIPSCNQICTLMQLHYFSLCFMSPTQDFSLVFHWNVHVLGHIKSIQDWLTVVPQRLKTDPLSGLHNCAVHCIMALMGLP